MLQLGTGVLFERLPRSYLSDFGCFLQKTYATYIAEVEKKCGPNFILTPSNWVVLRAVSLFQNWQRPAFDKTWEWSFPFNPCKKLTNSQIRLGFIVKDGRLPLRSKNAPPFWKNNHP